MSAAWLVASISALGVAVALVVLIEARERRRPQVTVRLQFGRDTTAESVVAVVDSVAALPRGSVVVFEARAEHGDISHWLSGSQTTLDTLSGSLRALLPGLRLLSDSELDAAGFRAGYVLRLRGRLRALRSDVSSEISAALLASLQPLGPQEQVVLRWVMSPNRALQVPRVQRGELVESEDLKRLRTKNAGGVVRARGLLAVRAGHPKRGRHLLARVMTALRTRSTPYGRIAAWRCPGWLVERALHRRSTWLGDRYSSLEIAGFLAWPVDAPALPGVSLGTSPVRMPSARLPQSGGPQLGTTTWPGIRRPVAQPVRGALSHRLVAGPTGTGKSTLLTHLVTGDIAAHRAVVLIDGKGDTARAVLGQMPTERHADVIVLDCASDGPLPGLRLFGAGRADLAADVVLGVLSDLFRDSWGPLSERYLRAGLAAISHDLEGTLAEVPYVFTDAAYRRRLAGRISDPLVASTFAALEAMSPAERQHQLAAPLNKLGTLLSRPVVRTVLGQADAKLDFSEVLRKGRVVVISLAPALIGAPAARLIGALSMFAVFQAVQRRSQMPESARKPAFVYVDEPRALGSLPMPLDALLEQARGLGVGVTLAPQSMAQLPKSVREAALTNIATRIVFRQDADDARLLSRDLAGISPDDLGDLAAFEAVARIGLGPGDVAPPVTLRTAPPRKDVSDPRAVAQASGDRFGQTTDAVDEVLRSRHAAQKTGAVGRRRRSA